MEMAEEATTEMAMEMAIPMETVIPMEMAIPMPMATRQRLQSLKAPIIPPSVRRRRIYETCFSTSNFISQVSQSLAIRSQLKQVSSSCMLFYPKNNTSQVR